MVPSSGDVEHFEVSLGGGGGSGGRGVREREHLAAAALGRPCSSNSTLACRDTGVERRVFKSSGRSTTRARSWTGSGDASRVGMGVGSGAVHKPAEGIAQLGDARGTCSCARMSGDSTARVTSLELACSNGVGAADGDVCSCRCVLHRISKSFKDILTFGGNVTAGKEGVGEGVLSTDGNVPLDTTDLTSASADGRVSIVPQCSSTDATVSG